MRSFNMLRVTTNHQASSLSEDILDHGIVISWGHSVTLLPLWASPLSYHGERPGFDRYDLIDLTLEPPRGSVTEKMSGWIIDFWEPEAGVLQLDLVPEERQARDGIKFCTLRLSGSNWEGTGAAWNRRIARRCHLTDVSLSQWNELVRENPREAFRALVSASLLKDPPHFISLGAAEDIIEELLLKLHLARSV